MNKSLFVMRNGHPPASRRRTAWGGACSGGRVALCLLLGGGSIERAAAQGTAFTYQGTLSANGTPAAGTNDLTFTLFDAPSGGVTVGTSNEVVGLVISNGLFTQILDFGSGVFNGNPRWLEIGVRPGGIPGDYTALVPRQLITATPYALTAGNLTGPVPATGLTGTYGNALTLNNLANVLAGTFSGDGSALSSLNAASLASGRMVDARLSTNVALLNARQTFTGTNVFTSANAGSPLIITNATDTGVAMDFRQRFYRWRVGQNRPPDSPSSPDVFFIIGDDLSLSPRTRLLIDTAGRVGIGTVSPASRLHVAGAVTADSDLVAQRLLVGETNVLASLDSSIVGGRFNTVQANADASAIGGGEGNTILTNAHHASLGGGQSNTVLGFYATIPGGQFNQATNYAFAAGRRAQANHPGAFVWADSQDADFSSTGTNQFNIRAGGGARFVTGGGGLTLDGQSVLAGVVPSSALSGGYSNALAFNNAGNTFVGSFTGNGAGLTNLNVSGGGTNTALLNANQTFAGANTFPNPANSFVGSHTGNGAGVTNLNAANLASGTVSGARLSGTYPNALTLNNAANAFLGSFTGNGAGLTNLNVAGGGTNAVLLSANQTFSGTNLFTNAANVFVGGFTGNAAGLTNFNVPGLSTNTALLNASQTFAGANTFSSGGNVFVGSLTGSGAGVTNLSAANLSSGTVPSARLAGAYSGALTLNNAANRFAGNGSGLTTLNAASLSSGTVADGRLSTNVALLNAPQTFSSVNTFTNAANIFVGDFIGDGAGLTNLNVGILSSNVALLNTTQTFSGANTFNHPANSFTGDGAGLTGLSAASLSSGTVVDGRLSANVALLAASQTFSGPNTFTNAANSFVGSHSGDGAGVTSLNAANLASGTVPSGRLAGTYSSALTLNNAANSFVGSHSGDGAGVTNLNAANLASGVVPGARLAGTYSNALTLNHPSNSFTGSGAGLTALNAASLSSGTVATARLSANVALLNAPQTFTSPNIFSNAANSFAGSYTGDGAGVTNLNAASLSGGLVPSARLAGTYSGALTLNNASNSFTGSGVGLTTLNAASLSSGTVADARLSTNVALLNASQTFTSTNTFSNAANTFVGSHTGDGAGVTNLNAASLAGGTVPSARLAGNYSGALTLNNAANRFTGNGSGLTTLNAASLSGTVADSRLSTNVALLNAPQTFSSVNTFTNAANTFVGGFNGDGAGLTNLNVGNLSSNVALLNTTQTFSGANIFNHPANSFTGDGAGLTGLSAASLSSGTVTDGRLSANVALLNASQTFTSTNTFPNAANTFVGSYAGDGAGLTNLNAGNLSSGVVPGARLAGTYSNALTFNHAGNSFAGSGAGLTALNAASLSIGTVANARLSPNVALLNAPQTFTSTNTFSNAANTFVGSHTGDGAGVTNLNAANLSGGPVPNAQLSGTYSGALTLNNAANRFTGNGAGLTTLNAASLSSGTVADARLSANVALLAASQIFTGTNSFTNPANTFVGLSAAFRTVQAGSFTGNLLRTPDNTPLELKVNGALALRLEPTASGYPNVIGGLSNSVIAPDTIGATIGGGSSNAVGGQTPIVGGGSGNTANGLFATIPGGTRNGATNYAFAAGRRAQAIHDGAFVWGDATDADIASTDANSVTFRAGGGYRFFSSTNANAGVSLATDGTAWGTISDRNAKKNFAPVDVRAVLEKLALVPVQQWNYKWETDGEVPHLGPMAQDFKHAFYPGRDDKVITTQEIDGVALAAIQGINQKVEEQAGMLRHREAEIQELKQTVAELKKLVNSLTHQP